MPFIEHAGVSIRISNGYVDTRCAENNKADGEDSIDCRHTFSFPLAVKRFLIGAAFAALCIGLAQLKAQSGEPGDTGVRMLFGGDTHFVWGVQDHQKKLGAASFVDPLTPLFQRADLRMVNLETTIGRLSLPAPGKYYVFRSEPESLQSLSALGIQAVSVANNHSLDYGPEGLAETIDYLKGAGIESVGAGHSMDAAVEPAVFMVKGLAFALFAANEVLETGMNGGEKYVLANARSLIPRIQDVRESGVIVIVNIHWGLEYGTSPTPDQIRLARRLIDNGAAAVIGHHPHVPQGIEVYHNGVICYSLGNFIFGSQTYHQRDNFLAELVFSTEKRRLMSLRIHPVTGRFRKAGHVVRPISSPESDDFWNDFRAQTAALNEKMPPLEVNGTSGLVRIVLD